MFGRARATRRAEHRHLAGPADQQQVSFVGRLLGSIEGQNALNQAKGAITARRDTPRGGYDGRGVWRIRPGDPLPAPGPLLAEEPVAFTRELAVLVARSAHGQAAVYPVVRSIQADGICREVIAPAPSSLRSSDSATAVKGGDLGEWTRATPARWRPAT